MDNTEQNPPQKHEKGNGELDAQTDEAPTKPKSKFLWVLGIIAVWLISKSIGGFLGRTVAESEMKRSASSVSSNKPASAPTSKTYLSNTISPTPERTVPAKSRR